MWDLINEWKVAVFVDNILVGTDSEEEYNEIVAEVLERLEENNLYVKPEKCSWKVNKINFLEVVIGQGKIKMKEEKVEVILN